MDAVDVLNGVIKTLKEENDRLKESSSHKNRIKLVKENKTLTAKLDMAKNAIKKQIDCEDEYPLIFIRDALDELE